MRIGIYCELLRDPEPTGIGLHIQRLVSALGQVDHSNEYLLYHQTSLRRRESIPDRFLPGPNFRYRPVRFPSGWSDSHPRLWWDVVLPRILRYDRIQVFHGPNHFLPARGPYGQVVTIHDLAYFKMDVHGQGQNAMLRQWTRKALDQAGSVIALSENTRRDVEQLGVESERVSVIYGGANVTPDHEIQLERCDEVLRAFGLPKPYILFVGTLQPRKNVPFLIRAFADLKRNTTLPHGLVLAGQRGSAAAEIDALVRELGLERDVVITGFVADWQLPLLYKAADLFVLPTLYEGFTLVTLEAMSYGTPVISTDTSSIREGTGDAAILVPVNDDKALAGAMERVLSDPVLRRSLVDRGREQASRFTWDENARQTLQVYEAVS